MDRTDIKLNQFKVTYTKRQDCITLRVAVARISGEKYRKAAFRSRPKCLEPSSLHIFLFALATPTHFCRNGIVRVRVSAWTPSRATLLSPDSSDQRWTARGRPRDPHPVDPVRDGDGRRCAGPAGGCACRRDDGPSGRCRGVVGPAPCAPRNALYLLLGKDKAEDCLGQLATPFQDECDSKFNLFNLTKSIPAHGPCLLPPKISKFFKISRHIESLDACMEY
jgi:hypothetical protein